MSIIYIKVIQLSQAHCMLIDVYNMYTYSLHVQIDQHQSHHLHVLLAGGMPRRGSRTLGEIVDLQLQILKLLAACPRHSIKRAAKATPPRAFPAVSRNSQLCDAARARRRAALKACEICATSQKGIYYITLNATINGKNHLTLFCTRRGPTYG